MESRVSGVHAIRIITTRFNQMGIRDTSYADIVEDLTNYRDSEVTPDPPYQSWVEKLKTSTELCAGHMMKHSHTPPRKTLDGMMVNHASYGLVGNASPLNGMSGRMLKID